MIEPQSIQTRGQAPLSRLLLVTDQRRHSSERRYSLDARLDAIESEIRALFAMAGSIAQQLTAADGKLSSESWWMRNQTPDPVRACRPKTWLRDVA